MGILGISHSSDERLELKVLDRKATRQMHNRLCHQMPNHMQRINKYVPVENYSLDSDSD
jgi:hypothetical protein